MHDNCIILDYEKENLFDRVTSVGDSSGEQPEEKIARFFDGNE